MLPRALLALAAVALVALPSTGLAAPSAAAAEPARFIVAFHDEAPGGERYQNEHVAQRIDALRMLVVAARDAAAFESRARQDPSVRYVERDDPGYARPFLEPNDALYAHDGHYGSRIIGAASAWDRTTGSASLKMAMIDSGLNKAHEEFAGQARVLQGYDYAAGDAEPDDTSGCGWHGTHVTGTAGATIQNGKGIAGMSQHAILPLKVFQSTSTGCSGSTTAIVNALRHAADDGAHIASNSWGAGGSSKAINDAIAYAHGKGVVLVAAAGNAGPCTDCVSYPWRENAEKVVVVASSTSADGFSGFSSEGPQVDVIAPGSSILSATSGATGYGLKSGTSMAAPHAAGTLALLKALRPELSPADLEAKLKATARDVALSSAKQGAGRIDADAATRLDAPPANAAPTASFTASCTGLTCSFDAGGSADADGTIVTYAWRLGDGETASGTLVTHAYAAGGTYTVTLTVTDDAGAEGNATQNVTVHAPSAISLSATPYKVKGFQHVDLRWSGASTANVDVWRDGKLLTTTANDGAHVDATGRKGSGTYAYRLCAAGTSTCSSEVRVTF